MAGYENFDRQYRLAAGPGGGAGFEIGAVTDECPVPLHIDFSFQKSEKKADNTGKVTVWNLSPEHLAVLNEQDCVLSLRAGYGSNLALIFAGVISQVKISLDEADFKTEIEVEDSLVEIRDTYVSLTYNGNVNWKKILDDTAGQLGVAVEYSYNAEFVDIPNGFSYVGPAKDVLTKGAACCNLDWSIQNGVLQMKKPGDVMSKSVYVLSPKTGLLGIPAKVTDEKSKGGSETKRGKQRGWEVEYFLNGAINIDDYVKLESKYAEGYFRVAEVEHAGDNVSGDWTSKAKLLEVDG